jgi:hypothetical protein
MKVTFFIVVESGALLRVYLYESVLIITLSQMRYCAYKYAFNSSRRRVSSLQE